ncbi:vWA domain-containing protein [Phaeocystidibacter luteus]|uniref:VWA domain-containing protein n=1 Tax=Phaeocystidibacter luteus TaxID=911197 RepID=A0A6N6RMS0_9FLAO|nr:VWA domain-containing protein [Phaeocystidibacter luteus]KAB2814856.1 VWA domain-containing protein [Phaeocystidibacter luteus]
MKRFIHGLVFALVLSSPLAGFAQQNDAPTTRILFIFDGSGSMQGRWETGKKIDVAQRLMTQMLDSLQSLRLQNLELALRVYGHNKPSPPQDCNDTHLEVPFGNNTYVRIKQVLRSIIPKGTTPIARSLEFSADDFTPCNDCRNIIILITDGLEECNEDPCAVSRMLQERGIALKPFVIGIGLDPEFRSTFECVGNYFDAAEESTFKKVLGVVISQALNNTSGQINLLDDNGQPIETDVPLAVYDAVSGKLIESFVHTLDANGNPDTLVLDPLVTYDVSVFTVPTVHQRGVEVQEGTHNHINIPAGRGTLDLRMSGSRSAQTPEVLVRRPGESRTLHVQTFNTTQEYLTGTYEIEILTLPRIYETVTISQDETNTVSIPAPGTVFIQTSSAGPGGVYVRRGDELIWVAELQAEETRHTFALQPGDYTVIHRPTTAQSSLYSKSKSFTVSPGGSTTVKL